MFAVFSFFLREIYHLCPISIALAKHYILNISNILCLDLTEQISTIRVTKTTLERFNSAMPKSKTSDECINDLLDIWEKQLNKFGKPLKSSQIS